MRHYPMRRTMRQQLQVADTRVKLAPPHLAVDFPPHAPYTGSPAKPLPLCHTRLSINGSSFGLLSCRSKLCQVIYTFVPRTLALNKSVLSPKLGQRSWPSSSSSSAAKNGELSMSPSGTPVAVNRANKTLNHISGGNFGPLSCFSGANS